VWRSWSLPSGEDVQWCTLRISCELLTRQPSERSFTFFTFFMFFTFSCLHVNIERRYFKVDFVEPERERYR